MEGWDIVSGVGITALAVAAARALESTRGDALIEDPYAGSFLTRSGTTVPMPTSWASIDNSENQSEAEARWATWWTSVTNYVGVRSRFFDEYFRDAFSAGLRQIVLLAAGLDTRAFRLPWPAGVALFEIDQPKVLEFKDAVLAQQGACAGCARHVVPSDLRADWPEALLRAGFTPQRPTAWLAEGLLGYLPVGALEALFARVHRLSAAGSTFAMDEFPQDIRGRITNPVFQDVYRRLGLNLATLWPDDDRSDPERWLGEHSWQVRTVSRAQAADQYGRRLGKFAGDTIGGRLLTARLR